MKKIFRLLALVGIVSLAAIPPAMSDTLGRCSYSCVSFNPFQRQNYSYNATYQQCCGQNRDELCDPGMAAIGLAFNGSKCAP
jgi:hypothetical protein